MSLRHWLFAAILSCVSVATASADQVRFLYVPIDANGSTKQVPYGPEVAMGERTRGLGRVPMPYNQVFRPTHFVTFRSPYTNANVTVPLTLPEDTPKLEHRSDRVVYNYGSYTIEVRFLETGAVEVMYNSGFFRPVTP